jgi:predicted GTPase
MAGQEYDPEISRETEEEIRSAILAELRDRPPTIGVIGVSGTGKSSTINAMFKTDLPVSHTKACTKAFRNVDVSVTVNSTQAAGAPAMLRVVDAPGLGEDLARDPEYLDMYRANLVRCDMVLWVMAGRNRAVALDQQYLEILADYHEKMVFGLNQIDLIEPLNWNPRLNLPSEQQEANIAEIVSDRASKISSVLGRAVEAFPYSAGNLYGLQELFTGLMTSCSDSKREWIFKEIKNFGPFDFVPAALRDRFVSDD